MEMYEDIECCGNPFPQRRNDGCISCLSCKMRVYEGQLWFCPICKTEQEEVAIEWEHKKPFIQPYFLPYIICKNKDCNVKSSYNDFIRIKKVLNVQNDKQLEKYKKNNFILTLNSK